MYYIAKVGLEFESDKGTVKKQTETYVVSAESVTDAEAIVHEVFKDYNGFFEVKSVTQTKIVDILSSKSASKSADND
jgi:hypothetical protein